MLPQGNPDLQDGLSSVSIARLLKQSSSSVLRRVEGDLMQEEQRQRPDDPGEPRGPFDLARN